MKMMNNIKVKDLISSCDDQLCGEEDYPSGGGTHHVFSWPPRSYTCSFCKREFRSAQALGGHMNVHRRDRARLRQSSPPNTPRDINIISQATQPKYYLPNLNLDPNPNMNFNMMNPSFSSSSECPPAFISTLPHIFSTSAATVPVEMRSWGKASHPVMISNGIPTVNTNKRLVDMEKKLGNSIKQLDDDDEVEEDSPMNKAEIIRLELEIGLLGEAKEDLDLELRLGYTTT